MQIIGKKDGLVLKDNFDGGATWAFEVGTQSMVCPIIVEDLNPPHQMLVEVSDWHFMKYLKLELWLSVKYMEQYVFFPFYSLFFSDAL